MSRKKQGETEEAWNDVPTPAGRTSLQLRGDLLCRFNKWRVSTEQKKSPGSAPGPNPVFRQNEASSYSRCLSLLHFGNPFAVQVL
jgi:hypothetical protein